VVTVPRAAEPSVRVGLLVDSAVARLASPGGLEIVDGVTDRSLARVPPGAWVTFSADAQGRLIYQLDGDPQPTTTTLVLARASQNAPISIGDRSYRGTGLIRAAGPGRVTAINELQMEDYLLGVVPREIGAIGDTLIEAAKAQAVAARTYGVRYLGRRAALGFDVFATVEDQVYGGIVDEHPTITAAIRATEGEILLHAGEPIEAFYHSTCAGQTVAIEEAWVAEPPRPYLVSVLDVDPATGVPFDIRSNRFQWTVGWEGDTLQRILARTLADSLAPGQTFGELRDIRVLDRTPSDRVRTLRISTTTRDFTLFGHELRMRRTLLTPQGLPLNSTRFDIRVERTSEGSISAVVADGGGWGHGIGMCQVGAMGRARAGQDYRQILRTYYPGTELRKLY
jgi:stage II sporulation protein D